MRRQVVLGKDAGTPAGTTVTAVHFLVNADGVLETSENAAQLLVNASFQSFRLLFILRKGPSSSPN